MAEPPRSGCIVSERVIVATPFIGGADCTWLAESASTAPPPCYRLETPCFGRQHSTVEAINAERRIPPPQGENHVGSPDIHLIKRAEKDLLEPKLAEALSTTSALD
ncbi:hypothetical protein ACCO45_000589 [Purpureocillium lilacinum]|uniref:Uncharacterized protein n=1 Tax=Purpureocillium lilacinum TaxID=33203 RepID=A0ACC4E4K9_PURLI